MEVAARSRIIAMLDAIVSRSNDPDRTVAEIPYRSTLAISALNEIDKTDIRDVSLPTMHSTLGVSRRTLEKAFSSVLGVSPGQYLIAYRLNHLRQSLLDSGGRVIDRVFEAGLKDPSRTAHHYHRLFGELPSHTLERCQQRASATI
jgi:AraC family ethanolamine operon transcriptional activator